MGVRSDSVCELSLLGNVLASAVPRVEPSVVEAMNGLVAGCYQPPDGSEGRQRLDISSYIYYSELN